jgi:hypothetical protein
MQCNSDKFRPGGLHEKHAVATGNLGTMSGFALKPVRDAGRRTLCVHTYF